MQTKQLLIHCITMRETSMQRLELELQYKNLVTPSSMFQLGSVTLLSSLLTRWCAQSLFTITENPHLWTLLKTMLHLKSYSFQDGAMIQTTKVWLSKTQSVLAKVDPFVRINSNFSQKHRTKHVKICLECSPYRAVIALTSSIPCLRKEKSLAM